MSWTIALIVAAGLVSGCIFRAPMLFVGSAAVVAWGLLTSVPWQTWLTEVAIFQASYLSALFVSTAWYRAKR